MSATSVPHVTMLHDRILCDTPSMMHQVRPYLKKMTCSFSNCANSSLQAAPLHPLEHMQKNFPASQLQRQVRGPLVCAC